MTQSVPSPDRIAAAGATAPGGHASPAGSLQGGAGAGARTDGSAEEVFVDFRDAGFTYDGERFVFRHLDLTVPQGQFLCLLGGNGSGKSTLAKHVNALLLPDEGEVRVFGCDTRDDEQTYFIRSNAGLVFQNPDDQIVGVPNPELRERVTRALAEVGLMGFEEHETHALSGGQKQRVAIAGVLAMDPAILILDEATAMLDPRGRAGLMRVVVLDGGAVVLDGAPAEVLTRADELRALSLEVPFACRLSLDLQARGVPVRTCVSDDELKEELCALRSKM